MHIVQSVGMALSSLRGNKLRSGLTLLSIAIGVFAIVGAGAAVSSLNASIDDQLASLGRNTFFIQKMPAVQFGDWSAYRNRRDISLRQGLRLKDRLTLAENVGLMNMTAAATVKRAGESTDPDVAVYGGDEAFTVNAGYEMAFGRPLSPEDVRSASDIVILGSEVAEDLLVEEGDVGGTVSINGHRYTVIGILKSKGAVFGQSQDNFVIVPITSAAKYFFDEWGSSIQIIVRARNADGLDDAVDQAIGQFRIVRGLDVGEENDFEVITNEELSDTFSGFTQYIVIFGLICGGFALLAAGFGIMNIMLVSVKERTREIGVRKAVGATRWDILSQFLIEAVTICQIGALSGALLGIGGGLLLGLVIGTSAAIPWTWIAAACGFCFFIGLLFGSYPAWQAAQLDPIEALRYE